MTNTNQITNSNTKEFWDAYYLKHGKLYGEYPSHLAYDVLQFIFGNYSAEEKAKLKVLEFGGGYGRNAFFLSDWGIDVTLVDFSKVALGLARSLSDKKVELIESDIFNLPLDNKFDIVYSNFCFHLFNEEERKRGLEEAFEALKQNGFFIGAFLSINDEDYPLKKFSGEKEVESNTFIVREKDQHFFTKAELENLLKNIGFSIIEIKEKSDAEKITEVFRNTRFWYVVAKKEVKNG